MAEVASGDGRGGDARRSSRRLGWAHPGWTWRPRRIQRVSEIDFCAAMNVDHPTTEDFREFLISARTAVSNANIARHLLAGCSVCRHHLLDMGLSHERLERLLRFPFDRGESGIAEAASSYDYSRTFATAEQALHAFLAKGKVANITPEELWAELASLSREEQERWVVAHKRFANPRLVQKLIGMSHAERFENPARMLHLANLARLAADACTVATEESSPFVTAIRI
jgi:hypothetical protein